MDQPQTQTAGRLTASLLSGALAGFALQQLLHGSPGIALPPAAGLLTMGWAFPALRDALRPARAALAALSLGALTAALFAAGGSPGLTALMQRDIAGQLLLAWFILATLPLIALRAAGAGRSGAALRTAALSLAVRGAAGAGAFLLSFAVMLPALKLLDLAGLPATRWFFAQEQLPVLLAGACAGAGTGLLPPGAAARAGELLARGLRLLALPALVLLLVFCSAFALNGLSAAGHAPLSLISGSVIAAALLVTLLAEPDGMLHRSRRLPYALGAGLSLLMLPAAGAALWSALTALRTEGAGPAAIGALTLALFAAGLALSYAATLLLRRSLAPVNGGAALVLSLWALLILPGVFSPEALAVRHQLARLERAETAVEALPLRSMALFWGPAGQEGIRQLQARFAGDPRILAHLAAVAQAPSPPLSLPPPVEPAPRSEGPAPLPAGATGSSSRAPRGCGSEVPSRCVIPLAGPPSGRAGTAALPPGTDHRRPS